jgi:hypothetical protein
MRLSPPLAAVLAVAFLASGCGSARKTASAVSESPVSSVSAQTQSGLKAADSVSCDGVQLAGMLVQGNSCFHCVTQRDCDTCCGGPFSGQCSGHCTCF